MADYNELLTSIASVIKTNNRREITGQILQNVLSQMVGSLGENYQLAGFATPSYNPQEPDQNVFYVTDQAGQYANFDNITLEDGLSFLLWKNEQWTAKTIGVATHQWVDNNYVSKAFFRQLFRPKDALGTEILANDTTSIVDNIQSMVGLWTERYLTALGYGTDGGGAVTSLAQLTDVQLTTPIANNDVLTYNTTLGKWTNTSGGGTGTVRQIKVGTVTYDPVNGLVSLPAYPTIPTNISSFTNDVGYITSSGSCSYATSAGYASEADSAIYAKNSTFYINGTTSDLPRLVLHIPSVTYTRIQMDSNGDIHIAYEANPTTYKALYAGDIISNGGDITINEPVSGGSSALWFQTAGTTKGNLRVKTNGELYFYTGTGAETTLGNLNIGTLQAESVKIEETNEINSYSGMLHLNYRVNTGVSLCIGGGNVGIGTVVPAYKLHVAGTIYATGGVTALSDERHKDIIDDTHLSIEQIAKMRSVLYRWDDGRADGGIYAGSIAQDWLGILPQVVTRADNDEGTLSLQYGVAALIASITIARKVVDHDKQIKELERQLSEANEKIFSLEDEVKLLKAA